MKKKKTKNLAAVAIALFGFTIIGTNVVAGYENLKPAPPPGGGGNEKGTLVSNQAGDFYCCCDGTRSCSSPSCGSSICDDLGL